MQDNDTIRIVLLTDTMLLSVIIVPSSLFTLQKNLNAISDDLRTQWINMREVISSGSNSNRLDPLIRHWHLMDQSNKLLIVIESKNDSMRIIEELAILPLDALTRYFTEFDQTGSCCDLQTLLRTAKIVRDDNSSLESSPIISIQTSKEDSPSYDDQELNSYLIAEDASGCVWSCWLSMNPQCKGSGESSSDQQAIKNRIHKDPVFPGPMYPPAYDLIQEVETYCEREDELDIVCTDPPSLPCPTNEYPLIPDITPSSAHETIMIYGGRDDYCFADKIWSAQEYVSMLNLKSRIQSQGRKRKYFNGRLSKSFERVVEADSSGLCDTIHI
jgi:hypothetical protein